MKIAVTGATGGLGHSLVDFLLTQKVEVVALGRNERIGQDLVAAGAQFYPGDLGDLEYLNRAFAHCNMIVHSGGLASPWGEWNSFYQANVIGTHNVLLAARKNDISKIIHLSTPSVYFSGKPFLNIKEDSPLPIPRNNYGKSKMMADELIKRETNSRSVSTVLLRPRAIFGRYDNAILPRILRLMERGFFPLPNSGKAIVDVTAVENVVQAIWLAISSSQNFQAEIFNVTNDQPMPVKELIEKISHELNLPVQFIPVPLEVLKAGAQLLEAYAKWVTKKEPLVSQYSLELLGITQTLCIDKLKNTLGYKPLVSIDQALKNFASQRLAK